MARPGEHLAAWHREHGRHDHPWRATTDRWQILVAEVMLHQTQVARVLEAWPAFVARFPDARATADAGLDTVLVAWGRLGYPRRARWLWEAACTIRDRGWPDDLTELPGVGRYTAGAVRAEADGWDTIGVDVNIRRVAQRTTGRLLAERDAEAAAVTLAAPLRGRTRLLALMDLGAAVCTARAPRCSDCPVAQWCATRGPLAEESPRRAAPFAGSLRARRGAVLARLRAGDVALSQLEDREALESLVADRLVAITGRRAHLARA